MSYKSEYEKWLTFDAKTREELMAISDEKELEDRFYKNLEFGTGGLRGIMGAGTNRMNNYTVARTTAGFANYLKENFDISRGVAIAYDCRNNSKEFAQTAARVLSSFNIKVYLFDKLMPTPVLSFTVRKLGCIGGIVITASHNPKEYNGYKVYNEYGCQLIPDEADKVIACIEKVDSFFYEEKSDLIISIGDEIVDSFCEAVSERSILTQKDKKDDLKIVYTPLHGTGNIPVRKTLLANDFNNVFVVSEQEMPDGNFSTVKSPNPEEKNALNLGIELAGELQADIVLGTDPDCDRVGIAVLDDGEYKLLSGNQVGALLVNYIFTHSELPPNPVIIKTIVTNNLGASIALSKGAKVYETLTGFKYIGCKAIELHNTDYNFVMGYEESYGYLVGTHSLDKDAVVASLLICEMAAYYKSRGLTLLMVLNSLYEKYGFCLDALDSFTFTGIEGQQKIKNIMEKSHKEVLFDDCKVIDYNEGVDDLPKSDVIKLIFDNGSWIAMRPSGTEPKMKIYYSIIADNEENSKKLLEKYRNVLKEKLGI